jgi:uncharacterized protein (DUF433 family)
VLGTLLDVWEIVQAFKDYDQHGQKMLAESALAPRQLRMALAYYREFRDETDEAIAANRRTIDEIEAEYPFLTSRDESGLGHCACSSTRPSPAG